MQWPPATTELTGDYSAFAELLTLYSPRGPSHAMVFLAQSRNPAAAVISAADWHAVLSARSSRMAELNSSKCVDAAVA